MPITLDCINLIIPIALIDEKCQGGWQSILDDNPSLPTNCYDDHLYRLGAMNSLDIQLLIDEWKARGFKPFKTVKGVKHWNDMCVVDTYSGPTLPCDWIVFDAVSQSVSIA